ncbi:hypothetical protein [Teredinibacter purpureus]|uniref:hypothetical protein n=1 Tax=Teredinibacter purpureus TaxID=2731756 RepID=UPI0005F7D991|nr:hypothetical protein [Teredinibacter purpureus]
MNKTVLIFVMSISCLVVPAYAEEHKDSDSKYPAPVTLETLSENEKKDPSKVGEALANTFLQMMEVKTYSDEDLQRSSRVLTMMTCIQFNRKEQLDSNDPNNSIWRVTAEWLSPDEIKKHEVLEITAINRDLASGYALCSLWESKHIPINRFTGFSVDRIQPPNKGDNEIPQ